MAFFTELEQIISNYVWKYKRFQIAKIIWRKNRVGGLVLCEFRQYYKATVIKTVWYLYKIDTKINGTERIQKLTHILMVN